MTYCQISILVLWTSSTNFWPFSGRSDILFSLLLFFIIVFDFFLYFVWGPKNWLQHTYCLITVPCWITGTPAQSPCALVQCLFSRFLHIPYFCLTVTHMSQHLSKSKYGANLYPLVVFLFRYQGLHQFYPQEITVTESNFFREITTPSDPWTYETQLLLCAIVLLVFNHFITNCYIYENSTVWIILQLSKFPGKIGGVTLVPLKTQSPRHKFLCHIYPSYYISVYTTICQLCCGFPSQVIWGILVLYMISQHLARLPVLRFIKIGLCQLSLSTSNRPHDRVSKSVLIFPSLQPIKIPPLSSSAHIIGRTCMTSSSSSPSTTMMTFRCLLIGQSLFNNSPPPLSVSISMIGPYHCIWND